METSLSTPWKCKRCGKCCLTTPCVFAQTYYQITKSSNKQCPELVRGKDGYRCLLIERSKEARSILLSGDCDDPELAHLKKKFNAVSIVREYFPNLTDDEIGNILWNYTGFPEFWNIPEDGWTAVQCLRTQLTKLLKGG